MNLYEEWLTRSFQKDGHANEAVWKKYLDAEQKIYEYILGEKVTEIKGKVTELSARFNMPNDEIAAFVDGINDILPKPYDVKEIVADTDIEIQIDFEKLYKKMVEYKAEHLYTLPQWKEIYSEEKLKKFYLEQKKSGTVVKGEKIGRNAPCSCGSGKKYKKCCGAAK